MSVAEVKELVDAFAAAAERSVRAGMDGVEIACGHGQLINLFLSPLTNRRDDAYGGDPGRRMRFAVEVIHAVRAAIGTDHILGIRVNGDDQVVGSLGAGDWQDICVALAATGAVDYISVSADFHESVVPTMHDAPGLYVPWATAIKALVEVPVICVGRIVDPAHAEDIVRRGLADAVGMTRAHIADPLIVEKLQAGRASDIRPCVGCVQTCIGHVQEGRPITCVFNPDTGSEAAAAVSPRSAASRRVVVVGGGPGGMEAARAAAMRGDDVVLYEREDRLGGAARRYAAAVPGRTEFMKALEWEERQIRTLGVRVLLNVEASAEALRAEAPDLVVLATGAEDFLPDWASTSRVVGVRRALDDDDVRGHVLVIDGDHRGQALFAAAALLERGSIVSVASVEPTIGGFVERGTRDAMLRVCGDAVSFRTLQRWVGAVASAEGVTAALEDVASLSIDHVPVDWIVTTGARSRDELSAELSDSVRIVVVGDALAPRRIEQAVHDGAAAVRLAVVS